MLELITKKISNKIIFALFFLMAFSSLTVILVTTSKVTEDSIAKTKENLEMLNAAMFQSLRNAMNTGDPIQIAKAEEDARHIKGVKNLTVAKSQALMELYPSNVPFTKDEDILKTFKSKQPLLLQTKNENGHNLRMVKPMIATSECLMCHANQNEGDVIGVMDLTFSLDESDAQIRSLVTEITIVSIILSIITITLILFISFIVNLVSVLISPRAINTFLSPTFTTPLSINSFAFEFDIFSCSAKSLYALSYVTAIYLSPL